ncbi:MAG TPA: uridine kinase [Galbitalea sp.]
MISDLAAVRQAVSASCPRGGQSTVIVAIDGFGGSGKSTLAAQILAEHPGVVVHTDDFASWDNPLDWWPRLVDQVLRPLSHNEVARYQRYDWDDRVLAEWHDVEPGGLVIVEGVSSSRAALRPYISLSIWVDTPRALRLQRGIQRDGEEMRDQWLGWMASEDAWASDEDPRSHADLVISGERTHRTMGEPEGSPKP